MIRCERVCGKCVVMIETDGGTRKTAGAWTTRLGAGVTICTANPLLNDIAGLRRFHRERP
jgi:hypothetical protein